jgi:hypothetical protein
MKTKFALTFFAAFLLFAASSAVPAQKLKFDVARPVVFDPNGIGIGFAKWIDGIGEIDSNNQTNFGLLLQKNNPSNDNVSADAELNGFKGIAVKSGDLIGYDIRNDSPCTSGSPRFNVRYKLPDGKRGLSFVGGCTNESNTPSPQDSGWRRLSFDLQNQSSPAIPAGAVLDSVILVVDEEGTYILDNIMFRGLFVDK